MKALLYKDFLGIMKYCRFHLMLCGIFLVGTAFIGDMEFMRTYVLVFTGVLPITLIAYEESEHWDRLALTMPLSRRMIVTEKYLVSLLLQGTATILAGLSMAAQMLRSGQFDAAALFTGLLMILVLGITMPSLMLPVIFKVGSERGRLAYTLVLGIAMGCIVAGAAVMSKLELAMDMDTIAVILAVAAVLLYPASWMLAVHWYEKREF